MNMTEEVLNMIAPIKLDSDSIAELKTLANEGIEIDDDFCDPLEYLVFNC